eukprot:CAMPEP_0172884466 /NCGR_PEP_ID=MMETSP1075-20121228/125268_1 /TAXON_ID=2916 /ORGANISM="Ceratium fusus, Strain PA161109" /LENGTH=205 /DNA_ID=CAMNT_0013737561 /DNA_START=314 /DNA_END=932 /DNA_ORIENTATION=+
MVALQCHLVRQAHMLDGLGQPRANFRPQMAQQTWDGSERRREVMSAALLPAQTKVAHFLPILPEKAFSPHPINQARLDALQNTLWRNGPANEQGGLFALISITRAFLRGFVAGGRSFAACERPSSPASGTPSPATTPLSPPATPPHPPPSAASTTRSPTARRPPSVDEIVLISMAKASLHGLLACGGSLSSSAPVRSITAPGAGP